MNEALIEVRLRVGGMTCARCQEKVEQALKAVPRVENAKASFSKGTAWVRYDPASASEADFARAIEAAGYSVGGKPVRMTWARAAAVIGAIAIACLAMLTGGMNLAGVTLTPGNPVTAASAVMSAKAEQNTDQGAEQNTDQGAEQNTDPGAEPQSVQKVRTTLESGRYQPITVTAGTPVEWTIDAPEGSINGCNNRMVIPAYGIEHAFTVGENVIRFTPDKAGTYPYSCWMGMITSTIQVVEPGQAADGSAINGATGGTDSASDAGQAGVGLPGAATAGSCCGLGGSSTNQAADSGSATSAGSCCGLGAITGN